MSARRKIFKLIPLLLLVFIIIGASLYYFFKIRPADIEQFPVTTYPTSGITLTLVKTAPSGNPTANQEVTFQVKATTSTTQQVQALAFGVSLPSGATVVPNSFVSTLLGGMDFPGSTLTNGVFVQGNEIQVIGANKTGKTTAIANNATLLQFKVKFSNPTTETNKNELFLSGFNDNNEAYPDIINSSNQTILVKNESRIAINVQTPNSAPTNIALSKSTVPENSAANTVVGTLSTTDANGGSHTYTLVSGTGSTDNASFNISGTSLRTSAVFNYEAKSSYSVRIRTTDSGGLTFEKAFTISVTNVNEAPTNILISSSSVNENSAANTVVGTFSSSDPDSGNTHTYALVSGTGSTDNASFNISGDSLRTSVVFNYETKSSYSIRVRSTDNGGAAFEKAITINVNNVNEAPTNITLSKSTIAENAGGNAVVGTLSTTDPDNGNTHNYTLVSGTGSTDNASFNISGTSLRANASFNYESKTTYSVRIRTTDNGGLTFEKSFTISVTNVNEPPVIGNITFTPSSTVTASQSVSISVNITDPENNVSSVTYKVGSGTNTNMTKGSGTTYTANLGILAVGTHTITVTASDGGTPVTKTGNVTVTQANRAPTVSNIQVNKTRILVNESVTVTVSASDPDNNLDRVVFGATGLASVNDTTAPYSHTFTFTSGGTKTISARAVDKDGAQSSAISTTITVLDGNFNGQDGTNVTDVIILANAVFGKSTPTDAMDLNSDTNVNLLDFIIMLGLL